MQVLWVRTMSTVINTLQQALDGPFQSLLSGSVPCEFILFPKLIFIDCNDHAVITSSTLSMQCAPRLKLSCAPHITTGSYGGSNNSLCTTKIALGRSHIEDSLRTLFVTVALSCLRNPSLQKQCGAVLPAVAASVSSAGSSKAGTCLLNTLCALSPKYYKDKK